MRTLFFLILAVVAIQLIRSYLRKLNTPANQRQGHTQQRQEQPNTSAGNAKTASDVDYTNVKDAKFRDL